MRKRKWIAALATAVVAVGLSGTLAKPGKKPRHNVHTDQGRHLALGHDKQHKFEDRDRETARAWMADRHGRIPVGFRETDRLPSALEARLQIGSVLDRDLIRRTHRLPSGLLSRLPAPPSGLRYRSIGGDIGLLDSADRLHDLLRLPRPPGF